jgi:hypothetical protein
MQEENSSVSGENVHIDDYDDYDAMNDQNEIDNYSIIGQNISKLKRVLGWFGFSNSDNFYDIGDWSIDDHVELYNLDGDGNMSNNEGEDVVRIMKREKMKKLRRILMKLLGLIAVGFLFFYIVVNLVIVNKEYSEIKEAHESVSTAEAATTLADVEDNIFKKPFPTSTSYTSLTRTASSSESETSSTSKSASSETSSTSRFTSSETSLKTTSKTKPSSTAKTTSKGKATAKTTASTTGKTTASTTGKTTASTTTKTTASTTTKTTASATTQTKAALPHIFEEIWEDAKEIGDELVDGFNEIVDEMNQKLHDNS